MRNEAEQMKELHVFKYVTVCSKILGTASQTAPLRETNSETGLERIWDFLALGRP